MFRQYRLFCASHLLVLTLLVTAIGCANFTRVNPAFDVDTRTAKSHLYAMEDQPATLPRPVVLVGPFFDPGLAEGLMTAEVREVVANDKLVIGQSFVLWDTFDTCRAKLIDEVVRQFPGHPEEDPTSTVEVDVIGFSMGGIVARYAALEPDPAKGQTRRLNIRRLFTIGSPHRGAQQAPLGFFVPLANDMRPGSRLLQKLDAAYPHAEYELTAYTRLGDWVVGEENTSPPGESPYWVSSRPFQSSHIQAATDPRILADLLRRLREEDPLSAHEPGPLP